jgi:hypothetical protein
MSIKPGWVLHLGRITSGLIIYSFISQSLPTLLSYPSFMINKTLPEKVMAKKQWDNETLKANFKKDFDNLAKPFSVVYIFIITLIFWLITGFKRKYFAENLVAAIHFYCFILIVVLGFFFLLQVMMWLHLDTWVQWVDSKDRALILFLLLFGWYCYNLFRRVYNLSKGRALISSLLTFVFTILSLLVLRASFYHIVLYKYLL